MASLKRFVRGGKFGWRFSIRVYFLHLVESFKKSQEIIGYDPTRSDGFHLILRDSKGVYRASLPSKSHRFLELKFIINRARSGLHLY